MSKTTPTQPQKKKPQQKLKTSSTPIEQQALDVLQQAIDVIAANKEASERLAEREAPLRAFHEAVEEAQASDIRIFWDVRVVRGKDTPFTRSQGVTHMPGALHPRMFADVSAMIQGEISDKVAKPLVAAIMDEADKAADELKASKRNIAEPKLAQVADKKMLEAGDPPTNMSGVLALAESHSKGDEKVSSTKETHTNDN